MAGYQESDNMCPLTFKGGMAMLLYAITSAASAAMVLAFLAGDTAATACVFFGAALGGLKCYDLKGLAIVGSVLVTASAVFFVRDSSGMVLEIYPHAWTKALFPTAVDWTTTRNGFLITVLHGANPLMCYIQNNAMLVSINVITFIGAYNGHGTIAADSCLMEASRTVTTYVPPVHENFMQVVWGTYNPTYISMQGMLLNEVTGCIDRVCIATFMGFFVGVLVRAQGKRAAFNTDFLGKRWIVPDIAPDAAPDTFADIDEEPPIATPGHSTLQDLFGAIDQQMADASAICRELRPFAATTVEHAPQSSLLLEVLAFMDRGILEETREGTHADSWTCSNGQLHAIVHLLNHNQFLLEDICNRPVSVSLKPEPVQYRREASSRQDIADDEFMKELSMLACSESDE
ncbi:hypothetical protein T484DRAFT_1756501 [Baffinella frigidus]|nr:hypothetical protein T484DRAFT_1756501 [Cryptophyta sp. CCMP2293]